MKRVLTIITGTILCFSALAAGTKLFDQYRLRAQMSVTPEQGAVLNFLDLIQFSKQGILEIEMLSETRFLVRYREGDICAGDSLEAIIRCKNDIGFPGVTFPDEVTAAEFAKLLVSTEPSKLLKEFHRREGIQHSQEVLDVISFLIKFKAPPEEVEELEILNPKSSFVIKVRNGDICLGEISEQLLRCKNEMGITSVGFQGDAD